MIVINLSLGRPAANRYISGGEIMIIDYRLQHGFATSPHVLTTAIVIRVLLQVTLDDLLVDQYFDIPTC